MANICYARTSIIAGLPNNSMIAPLVFNGYYDTAVVLTWVKEVLLPEMPIGSVIIWDNASFHKSEKLQSLIEEFGNRLFFFSAYSPDLNPIEGWWAVLKRSVTDGIRSGLGFYEAVEQFFKKDG
jgi:transposase